jgi:L-threonylcarbamoyladenylate synthase
MIVLPSLQDQQLIELLRSGALGILPSDTIYGLAANAGNPQAVERLYALKHREHKPGTIIAANIEQLIDLGVEESMLRQVAHLWPNPLSIIIPASEALAYLDQDVGSLAVRIPKDEELRQLLAMTGPLATSSANLPGEPPANNLEDAERYFGDQVDFYVEGGDRSDRPPSTVVRVENGVFNVLRKGAVAIDQKGNIV